MLQGALDQPVILFLLLAVWAITLSAHEFAHAAVAVALGDETPRRMGRYTLNPLAHLDILGTLLVFLIGFGWAKPVPFDPNRLRLRRWGSTIVSLAGPGANLALIVIFGTVNLLLVGRLGVSNLLIIFIILMVKVSTILLIFNLIPVPPLDGSKALLALLAAPKHVRTRYLLVTQGPFILLGLILLDTLFGVGIFFGLIDAPFVFVARLFRLPIFTS